MTRQVAFLTGQSDPGRCALSPAQSAFLDALSWPDVAKVQTNFPYDDRTRPYRNVSLAAASWHNTRQYLRSRTPVFVDQHRSSVVEMAARAEQTLLLAGSCGLELLANVALPDHILQRLHVFAYGPVARRAPACDLFVLRGRGDWISRAWSGRVDQVVDCGHMDYLANPQVLALCREWGERVMAREVS